MEKIAMYDTLTLLRGKFLTLTQAQWNCTVSGMLVSLNRDVAEIKYFDNDGKAQGGCFVPLGTITDIEYGTPGLNEREEAYKALKSVEAAIEEVFR